MCEQVCVCVCVCACVCVCVWLVSGVLGKVFVVDYNTVPPDRVTVCVCVCHVSGQLLASIAPDSKHTVSMEIVSDTPDAFMSYAVQVRHASTLPPTSPSCAITLTTSLATPSLKLGLCLPSQQGDSLSSRCLC